MVASARAWGGREGRGRGEEEEVGGEGRRERQIRGEVRAEVRAEMRADARLRRSLP